MKRLTCKVVLFLLLGAIVNVAVAWGIRATTDPMRGDPELISDIEAAPRDWFIARYTEPGSLAIVAMIQLRSTDAMTVADQRVPKWSRIRQLPAYVEGDPMPMMYDLAFGWPAASMWSAIDKQRNWQSGSIISRVTLGSVGSYELPLRPVWPGFTINTLFYTVIVWLLFAFPGITRRTIHRRRGRCIKCGYNLRGATHDVCPECGSSIKATQR